LDPGVVSAGAVGPSETALSGTAFFEATFLGADFAPPDFLAVNLVAMDRPFPSHRANVARQSHLILFFVFLNRRMPSFHLSARTLADRSPDADLAQTQH
jgi:hypothetical protein